MVFFFVDLQFYIQLESILNIKLANEVTFLEPGKNSNVTQQERRTRCFSDERIILSFVPASCQTKILRQMFPLSDLGNQ